MDSINKNCKMADSKASVSVLGIFTEENYKSQELERSIKGVFNCLTNIA